MFTDDQDIERTLRTALDVRPSADFERRVEERIRRTARVRGSGLTAWLSAAAAIVIAATWWLMAGHKAVPAAPPSPVQSASAPAPGSMTRPEVPATPVPGSAAVVPAIRRPVRPMPVHVATRVEPEVIVPANQLEMIRRLVRELGAGQVELSETGPATATPPADIVVPPVVIEPIPLAVLDGTGTVPPFKDLD